MDELIERLKREYSGGELIKFLINECEEKIGNREVCIYAGNLWNLIYHSNVFLHLLDMGFKVKHSSILCIIAYEQDIIIIIANPFKGAD